MTQMQPTRTDRSRRNDQPVPTVIAIARST